MSRPSGLAACLDEDLELMGALHELMVGAEVDMTLFFALADVDIEAPTLAPLHDAFYDESKQRDAEPAFSEWLTRYAARVVRDGSLLALRRARMYAANPRYVLRNYLAQQAIDRAEQGDDVGIHELLEVMRHPYDDQPGRERFAQRRPDWHASGQDVRCCRAVRDQRQGTFPRLDRRSPRDAASPRVPVGAGLDVFLVDVCGIRKAATARSTLASRNRCSSGYGERSCSSRCRRWRCRRFVVRVELAICTTFESGCRAPRRLATKSRCIRRSR